MRIKILKKLVLFGISTALLLNLSPARADDRAAEQPWRLPIMATFNKIDPKIWYLSHGWANGMHQSCEWNKGLARIHDRRLVMNLAKHSGKTRPIGCTELQSHKKLSYGRYETRLKAASGDGLNTAFFTYIGPPMGVDDHGEIDFEFLGKDPRKVEITHWYKGKPIHGGWIDLGFDSSKEFHNYAFVWAPDAITWYVDDKEIYKTPPGTPIPSDPQKMFLSLWSGSKENTDWLGTFKYDRPVTAEVMWAKFTPAKTLAQTPAKTPE